MTQSASNTVTADNQIDPTFGRTDREELHRIGMLHLSLLGLFVGIITGLGAVLFRLLIGLIHNLLFLGQISAVYDANQFTPASPWGAFVILVPVIGGLGVTFLVAHFAPEAKGHGVPEVIDAVYRAAGLEPRRPTP